MKKFTVAQWDICKYYGSAIGFSPNIFLTTEQQNSSIGYLQINRFVAVLQSMKEINLE